MNRRAGKLFPCNPISLFPSLPLFLSLHDISRSFSTVFGRNGVSWRKKVALLENAYAKKEGGREKKCEREKNRASTTSRANEFITIGSWSSTRVYTHACPPVRGEPIDNQGANQMITSRQNACWLSTTAGIIKKKAGIRGLNWECGISEALANCETRPPLPPGFRSDRIALRG